MYITSQGQGAAKKDLDLLDLSEEFFETVWKKFGTKAIMYLTYGPEGWGVIVPEQKWYPDGVGFWDGPDSVKCPANVEIIGELISTEAFKK